ncbi:MAG TPA: HAMP domain-containing protein, partial [Gemmatimonadaceae bacterium]|nr:HAMP domain-containing protein [Gemmatimonadaceae bacterium]
MTLRTRLILGLFTIAVILVVPLLVATRSLDQLHGETERLREGDFAASLLLGRLRDAMNDLRSAELALQFVRDAESRRTIESRIATVRQLTDSLDRYALGGAATDIREAMTVVADNVEPEFAAATSGRPREAERIAEEMIIPAISRGEASIKKAEISLRQRTSERVDATAIIAQRGIRTAIIGLTVALIGAAIIAALLTQSVSRPVYELERGMRRVADGDFQTSVKISHSRTDEFGRLAASFQDMTRQLA